MLKELTRDDWLAILDIPVERVPQVLILRGTRDLAGHYRRYQAYFDDIRPVRDPNLVLDDIFLAELAGRPVAYASVYGAPMASEVVHVFGVLGTGLVLLTGCCGGLADDLATGDLLAPTAATCGEGAAQYYRPGRRQVSARLPARLAAVLNRPDIHPGLIYTTSALMAEGQEEVEAWFQEGHAAVDMETAAVFAVADYFNMDRAALLYVFDTPRQGQHILGHEGRLNELRAAADERMIGRVLALVAAQ